jgi:hypothetical protein
MCCENGRFIQLTQTGFGTGGVETSGSVIRKLITEMDLSVTSCEDARFMELA